MLAGSSETLWGQAKVGGLCGIEVRHQLVGDLKLSATGKIPLCAVDKYYLRLMPMYWPTLCVLVADADILNI